MAAELLNEDPDLKIGILARDCNNRGLNVLKIWDQLGERNLKTIVLNCCPASERNQAKCSVLKPEKTSGFKKEIGIDDNFFRIGGHSLNAVTMTAKIHKALNYKVDFVKLWKLQQV